jgi:hypothetical protein
MQNVKSPRGYWIELEAGHLSLNFELMSTVNHSAEAEIKAAIQSKFRRETPNGLAQTHLYSLQQECLQRIPSDAGSSVDKKFYKEETDQAIERFTEYAKMIEKAVKDWEGEVKDKEWNVGKESRKRKLEEIEDHAEDLKKLTKMMKDK